jgi:hypothetical protein
MGLIIDSRRGVRRDRQTGIVGNLQFVGGGAPDNDIFLCRELHWQVHNIIVFNSNIPFNPKNIYYPK